MHQRLCLVAFELGGVIWVSFEAMPLQNRPVDAVQFPQIIVEIGPLIIGVAVSKQECQLQLGNSMQTGYQDQDLVITALRHAPP